MFGLPESASAHAPQIDNIIIIIHWFMLVLFVGWGAFYIYCLVRFRASKNPKADYHGVQSHTSTYVEAGVAVIEAILLLGFAFPLWRSWVVEFPGKDKNPVMVHVVAEQFSWNFHYPGADGIFGKMAPEKIDTQTNPLGLDRASDPEAKDDVVVVKELHLPVNRPALMWISSKDVIHSFKVVAMRVTQDAVPGLKIPISFTPTKTGRYDISCAQLCGNGHYKMQGFLVVDTQEDYDKWIAQQSEAQKAEAENAW